MGSFFTNVQLLRGGRLAGQSRAAVIAVVTDAIKEVALEDGFVLADKAGKADRTVLIGGGHGDSDGRWLTIYDEGTEGQDDKRLDALAGALSAELETSAVTVLVHDSDVLELRLFEDGKRADRYNNAPGYFDERVSKKAAAEAAGHPERWSHLLRDGVTAAAVRAIWSDETLHAETVLAKTAAALGWNGRLAGTGYSYTVAGHGVSGAQTILRLRMAERPKAEQTASGPPRFERGGYMPEPELSVGEPLQLHCDVRNVGGASRGLAIVVWGEAIDRGLVAPSEVEVIVGMTLSRPQAPRVTVPLAAENGIPGLMARFADLDLRAGHDIYDKSARRLDPRTLVDLAGRSGVSAIVKGAVVAPGAGKLHVGFVPLAAQQDGQCAHTMSLSVRAASRRPLRARADVEADALRALDPSEDTLAALVSFDLDRVTAAAHAADAVEKWSALLARPLGKWSIAIFRADGGRVGSGSSKAAGFFTSPRWAKLRKEFASEQRVSCSLPVGDSLFGPDGDPDPHVHGFTFGTGMIPAQLDAGDRELPTLALSLDLTGAVPDAAAALHAIVDDLMARAQGVQALVARWDGVAGSIDRTPYERATGIYGDLLLTSWQKRYLRGVGDGPLWLGPALLERLGDRGPLERAAASVVPVGAGVRVTPAAGAAGLDALERALAPLLPRDAGSSDANDAD